MHNHQKLRDDALCAPKTLGVVLHGGFARFAANVMIIYEVNSTAARDNDEAANIRRYTSTITRGGILYMSSDWCMMCVLTPTVRGATLSAQTV